MKRKITVRLSEQLVERLEAAAKSPSASKTAIVEAALHYFLSSDTNDHAALSRRLNWMSRQLEQLERDLRIVNETVALHARYHLTITPPLPSSKHRAACALAFERFEVFAAQVGRRVHMGTPLMRETMDRLSTTKPDLFAPGIEEAAPLGAPLADPESEAPASIVVDEEPELSAAAREDGSNACFPEGRRDRPR
jgi:predicted transcriptional regulator